MLIQSANDAAQALALRGSGLDGAVRRGDEHEGCGARPGGHAFRTNPHGLDASGHVSSARDATLLVRYALGVPFIRAALERRSVTLAGGREFPATNDLLTSWPPLLAGKTGHTEDAGWSEAAAARARGVTVYGTVLGSATSGAGGNDLRTLLRFGLDRYRRVTSSTRAACTRAPRPDTADGTSSSWRPGRSCAPCTRDGARRAGRGTRGRRPARA